MSALDALIGSPDVLLVVSDLHLCSGGDAVTGRFSRRENFLEADAFRAFLEHHRPTREGSALLVLNGDIFDFLRIDAVPRSDQEFNEWARALTDLGAPRDIDTLRRLSWREGRYGLRTDDYKSVWKLLRIMRGHPTFFASLGWWVSHGGRIVFVKGNHDLELYWPLVQRAVRSLIAAHAPQAPIETLVLFCDAALRVANVYIEHGHRFERHTAVEGGPVRPNGRELSYPLGSQVNRYVINRLEGLEPFLDNVKPQTKLLWSVLRRHPLKVLRIAFDGALLLFRVLRSYWFRDAVGFLVFALVAVLPPLTLVTLVLAAAVPAVADWLAAVFGRARVLLGALGMFAPYIVGAVRDLFPKRKSRIGENAYAAGIHDAMGGEPALRAYPQAFGVIGHTHEPDVQALPPLDRTAVLYLNTGSWTPIWDDARPDLTGVVLRTFARFTRHGDRYTHELLEWTWLALPEGRARLLDPA